jgi:Ca2+-binding RTX toxin-like protein
LSSAAPVGNVALAIHQLVGDLNAQAGDDSLLGGTGDDLMLGDSQTFVAAYLGSFTAPIAAGVKVTGDRLVENINVGAGRDTQRGGDGNDTLVGDSDTTLALLGNGGVAPVGSFGMTRLAEKLTVAAGTDDLKGELGINITEQGNRAATTLVKTVSISALSKTSVPAAARSLIGMVRFARTRGAEQTVAGSATSSTVWGSRTASAIRTARSALSCKRSLFQRARPCAGLFWMVGPFLSLAPFPPLQGGQGGMGFQTSKTSGRTDRGLLSPKSRRR